MQDFMLKTLVAAVEEMKFSVGITLAIPGGVITGLLITEKEFKTRFAEDFTNGLAGGPHEELKRTFAELGEGVEGHKELSANLIHLKGARYVSQNGVMPSGAASLYWRGKIEDVTGFSLGDLRAS